MPTDTIFNLYTVSQKTSRIIFVITTSNFHQIGQFLVLTVYAPTAFIGWY